MADAMGMRIGLDRLKSVTKFARKKKMFYKFLQKAIRLGRARFETFIFK